MIVEISERDMEEIWSLCLDIMACAPLDMDTHLKMRAVALHLALVCLAVCNHQEASAFDIIDATAVCAKNAVKTYGKRFAEISAHIFEEPDAKQ